MVGTADTDATGFARFQTAAQAPQHFVIVRRGGDVAASALFHAPGERPEPERQAALIFTDRSVYRPLQRVQWKVVLYQGVASQGSYRVVAQRKTTVKLLDPNGKEVASAAVQSNAFGSAAGEFTLPAGRPLGSWQLQVEQMGSVWLRVEEYKRPTFEVTFEKSGPPARLNQPAAYAGKATYYFGLPVSAGEVRWKVERVPVFFGWGWRPQPVVASQVIAAGRSPLGSDGRFQIQFTPEADPRLRDPKLTFRYQISVDVTDEGGETRSASQTVRLGLSAVEAQILWEQGFVRAGAPGAAKVTRSDLNGAPKAGKGTWRLVRLQPPERPRLPADEPVTLDPKQQVITEGDKLQPRWSRSSGIDAELERWPGGAEVASGALQHDANGEAPLALPPLEAGAYRLHYETADELGAKIQISRELVAIAPKAPPPLALFALLEKPKVRIGETARIALGSALPDQRLLVELWRDGRVLERRVLEPEGASILELPITADHRGGFAVRVTSIEDFQLLQQTVSVSVPWEEKELQVELSTFRDRLKPGGQETWRVTVKDAKGKPERAAELLAYMYDRSLDAFGPHLPPSVASLYPRRDRAGAFIDSLGAGAAHWLSSNPVPLPALEPLSEDQLSTLSDRGIGGMGSRRAFSKAMAVDAEAFVSRTAPAPPPAPGAVRLQESSPEPSAPAPVQVRENFAETAFWRPNLLTGKDGSAAIELTVPDSVTSWNVWVHGLTRDLRGGSTQRQAQSVKDLMVRPYLPRFLREGDRVQLEVAVNNASARELKGELQLELLDPATGKSVARELQLDRSSAAFTVAPGKGTTARFSIVAPKRVGEVVVQAVAKAGDFSDGEKRALPLLPSRQRLTQSKFAALQDKDRRELSFPDLAKGDDPTRINEQLVVTIDAQLFYSVLGALPYLTRYPYECTEQTLNRFVSTGIVGSVFKKHPAVASMAKQLSARKTQLETFDAQDPNRTLALEETPWVVQAEGGKSGDELINALDPAVAAAEQVAALDKLTKAQTSIGGFPWFPGGPPSPYMTLYIAHGLGRAAEFEVDVPKQMVQRAWGYLARHFRDAYADKMLKDDCCWEFLTFLNYVASSYPDASWTGDALTLEERRKILDHSFKHWRAHSPYLKGMMALTLQRMGRPDDARKVFDSVMDSAKTTRDEGTFWAPEDRSWLWYRDTIESHAFALRALMALDPKDPRRDGLVQWLFLNKKLNHWKSTRATAEVVYALVKHLESAGQLGVREESVVTLGGETTRLTFEPNRFTGRKRQLVLSGPQITPKAATVVVEKTTPGLQFASATWHYSTDALPSAERGDLFQLSRRYHRRAMQGKEAVLTPLQEGAQLAVGDELEVHLSVRARHAAEYVHLRDPRGAGFEPERVRSGHRYDLGIAWFEEVRDSGTSFFFEQLPAGEYTLKYRVRASQAGVFRVGSATLQSMYAPEFSAFSTGAVLRVEGR